MLPCSNPAPLNLGLSLTSLLSDQAHSCSVFSDTGWISFLQYLTTVSTLVQPLAIRAKVSKVLCCLSFAFCWICHLIVFCILLHWVGYCILLHLNFLRVSESEFFACVGRRNKMAHQIGRYRRREEPIFLSGWQGPRMSHQTVCLCILLPGHLNDTGIASRR